MVSSVLTFDGGKSSTTTTAQHQQLQQQQQHQQQQHHHHHNHHHHHHNQQQTTTTQLTQQHQHHQQQSSFENQKNNYQTKSSSGPSFNDPSTTFFSSTSLTATTEATTTTTTPNVLTDQISILFPKCRPRNDVNLNHLNSSTASSKFITDSSATSGGAAFAAQSSLLESVGAGASAAATQQQSPPTSSLSSSDSSITKSPNTAIGTNPFLSSSSNNSHYRQQQQTFRHGGDYHGDHALNHDASELGFENNREYNNKSVAAAVQLGNTKIMSSNIDGVAKYSQKRPNHGAKSQPHQQQQQQQQQHNYYQYNQNPFIKDSERSIWELRTQGRNPRADGQSNNTSGGGVGGNNGGASKVLNSPDLIEMETKLSFQKNHQIKVGRSPVNQRPPGLGIEQQQGVAQSGHSPGQKSMISDGEVVVFDDIGESYTGKGRGDNMSSLFGGGSGLGHTPDLYSCTADLKKNDYNDLRNISGIMEYDGSPRKFGQTQQIDISMYTTNIRTAAQTSSSSTLFPPRPGFPQRVVNNPSPVPPQSHSQPPVLPQQPQILEVAPPPQPTITLPTSFSTQPQQCNTADDTSNDVSEICNSSDFTLSDTNKKSTFDYLYEFSETRKVLEEFFKCPASDESKTLEKFSDFNESDVDSVDIHYEFRENDKDMSGGCGESYIGSRLAKSPEISNANSPKENGFQNLQSEHGRDLTDFDLFLDSASRSSGEIGDNDHEDGKNNGSRRHSRCFRYSPETTDYDSNCGDLDSEVSLRLIGSEFGLSGEFNNASTYTTACTKFYTSMPVLEDGLSSGHASDTDNNNQPISIVMDNNEPEMNLRNDIDSFYKQDSPMRGTPNITPVDDRPKDQFGENHILQKNNSCKSIFKNQDPDLESLYSIRKIDIVQLTPPPPAPAPHRNNTTIGIEAPSPDIQAALKDIRTTLQRTKALPTQQQQQSSVMPDKLTVQDLRKASSSPHATSPIWVPRQIDQVGSLESIENNPLKPNSGDEDEADTDLETDRLLGHQRLDDMGFYDDNKTWCDRGKPRSSLLTSSMSKVSPTMQPTSLSKNNGNSMLRQGMNSMLPTTPEMTIMSSASMKTNSNNLVDLGGRSGGVGGCGGGVLSSPEHDENSVQQNILHHSSSSPPNLNDSPNGSTSSNIGGDKKKTKSKEVLIEGVLFRARYLGSTQLVCEGQPTKSTRMIQAEEAVSRIKSPDGETQPSTEVDLFISTEKIMVLNTDLKEIMMDHALRTISYIADIGDLVVLMARRRFVPSEMEEGAKPNRTPKMICHVFESEEAQFIAQSIGQAFQVAYMEFLKANGIEDHSFVKEMDYQEVLNSQEIFGDELEIFAKKELQKEVVVPKAKGEILGVVIVESGWGSMLPTVVIANLLSTGAAARCGQLNIGDQIIAINGLSLVGLPLSTCQNYIKNTKNQTVVKFTVVPCAPVVEVKIKRPNTKYQLGFSVQNGVICSLLRGGIAERGGVRVGHRIIEINNQSVVAVPHEKIVNLLATSVGEILMKTMPTSMFRLLTGQENPIYI